MDNYSSPGQETKTDSAGGPDYALDIILEGATSKLRLGGVFFRGMHLRWQTKPR